MLNFITSCHYGSYGVLTDDLDFVHIVCEGISDTYIAPVKDKTREMQPVYEMVQSGDVIHEVWTCYPVIPEGR